MSDSPSPTLEPGVQLGSYRLIGRIEPEGRDLWAGEEISRSRRVVLRVLSRTAPRDTARRESLLSTVRQRAAIRHPGVIPFLEVCVAGDILFTVQPSLELRTLEQELKQKRPDRNEFLRLAWQLNEAIAAIHRHKLVHGELNPFSAFLDAAGNVRVGGIGPATLADRRDRGELAVLARRCTMSELAFMPPEAIAGQPLDVRADLYAFGVLLYFAATGRAPFEAASPEELGRKITATSPRAPQEINREIEPELVRLIGRAIFKNKASRFASSDEVRRALLELDPTLERRAGWLDEPVTAAGDTTQVTAEEITAAFLVGEIPFHELLTRSDPEAALRHEAKFQQLVSEAVYLYDGEVLDSFGPRSVAIITDAARAVEAACRIATDLADQQGEPVEPRVIIHYGKLQRKGSAIIGAAAELTGRLIRSLQPMQIVMTAPLLEAAGIDRSDQIGHFEGIALFDVPAAATPHYPAWDDPAAAVEPMEEEPAAAPPPPSARRPWLIPAAMLLLIVAAGSLVFFKRSGDVAEPLRAAEAPPASSPQRASIWIDVATASEADHARLLALAPAVRELLGTNHRISVLPSQSSGAVRLIVAPDEHDDAAWTVRLEGSPNIASFTAGSIGAATEAIVNLLSNRYDLPRDGLTSSRPGVMESYTRAVALVRQADPANPAAAMEAVRSALASDPDFRPALRLGLELADHLGDDRRALELAERLARLEPANAPVHRRMALARLAAGDPAGAIRFADAVLLVSPGDPDAISILGRFAASTANEAAFQKIARMATAPESRVHPPDILLAANRFERAAPLYYEIEEQQPSNAALVLKIGRIAALRESHEVARLQLDKLRTLSPSYGAPLLEAYVKAKSGDAREIGALLRTAEAAAGPMDDFHSSAAEIWALRGERARVVESLEKAAARSEGMTHSILLRKPFFYLGYDARSTRVMERLERQKGEIDAALQAAGY
jgi:tetratricopeptide (TPR) repeat protein